MLTQATGTDPGIFFSTFAVAPNTLWMIIPGSHPCFFPTSFRLNFQSQRRSLDYLKNRRNLPYFDSHPQIICENILSFVIGLGFLVVVGLVSDAE